MRTVKANKLIRAVCAGLILFVSTPAGFAYPPDNAAVLYYRAFLLYETDPSMRKMLSEFSRGKIKLDERKGPGFSANILAVLIKEVMWDIVYFQF